MNDTETLKRAPVTIGFYLRLPSPKSQWGAAINDFSFTLLHHVITQVLSRRGLICPDNSDRQALTLAAFQSEIVGLVAVTDKGAGLSIIWGELSALEGIEQTALAWFCGDEGIWRDWYPKHPVKPFAQRIEELKTWSEKNERIRVEIGRCVQFVKALSDSPEWEALGLRVLRTLPACPPPEPPPSP